MMAEVVGMRVRCVERWVRAADMRARGKEAMKSMFQVMRWRECRVWAVGVGAWGSVLGVQRPLRKV